jgi:hypothetical protein
MQSSHSNRERAKSAVALSAISVRIGSRKDFSVLLCDMLISDSDDR